MNKLRIKTVHMIEEGDWSDFVSEVYGRPYCFQQQDGCQPRGTYNLEVPGEVWEHKDSIPEKVNGTEMCVSFEKWLERDPKAAVDGDDTPFMISLFWVRNFYPQIEAVANDLHEKGLLPEGDYVINIDW